MKKYIYKGNKCVRVEEDIPKCGEDFCDACGDCLACCGEDPCFFTKDHNHFWVIYEEENAEKF